jgi:phage-related protein
MKNIQQAHFQGRNFLALLAFAMLMWVAKPALGQSTVPQPGPVGPPAIQPGDDDGRRSQMAAFDRFLDGHPEVAEQLRANPSLVSNQDFLEQHPALQQFLQEHRGIREEISQNPNAFMRQEDRFDRREDQGGVENRDRDGRERDRDFDRDRDGRREQVAVFDRFLDRHPELAEQLRQNPSLVGNREFVENHPALQQFLRDNPGIGTEINENPRAFMHEEERFDRNEDRFNRSDDRSDQIMNRNERSDRDQQSATGDRDMRTATTDRDQRAATTGGDQRTATGDREDRTTAVDRDQRTTATDQSATGAERDDLVNGKTATGTRAEGSTTDRDATTSQLTSTDRFLDSHPEIAEQLQKNPSLIDDKDFLKHHPALQDYLKSHPEVRQEVRQNPSEFMRQEARFDQREALSTHSMDRDDMASFSTFLGAHSTLAQELSKNPSLANNKEFQASHPELREFLKTHPAVQAQLTSNPATVMNSVQATNATKVRATEPKMKH